MRGLVKLGVACVVMAGVATAGGQAVKPAGAAQAKAASAPAAEVNPQAFDAVPAKVSFDIVSFRRCADGKEGTTKVDMAQNGDSIAYHCESIARMIYFAYWGSVNPWTLEKGYPSWVDDERYEFIAKVAPEDIAAWQKLDLAARRVLMRGVLAGALKLKVRLDSTPETAYVLTVAKSGSKLTEYKDGDQTKLPDGRVEPTGRQVYWAGTMAYFQDYTLSLFAEMLTAHYDRRVVDRTGLDGDYNFAVTVLQGAGNNPTDHKPTEDSPSTMDGVAKLGLRLDSAKVAVERLAIEHVERPGEN